MRGLTSRRRGIVIKRMVCKRNRYLQRWFGDFRLSETPSVLEELDNWIRRRLRCFLLKQWRLGRRCCKALHRLGVADASMVSGSRKGPWRLSKSKAVHEGRTKMYFQTLGLVGLADQWRLQSQAI